jgi:hypothetical protein
MGYDSPFIAAKINSLSEIAGMTVPMQMQRGGSMSLQQPRSRFMITDILGGNGKLRSTTDDEDRTPSPQPRDLSIPSNSMRHQNDDSDDDQSDSSMLDDHSIGSGNYPKITMKITNFKLVAFNF